MGNALEYAICKGLQKRKITPASHQTSDKLKRLKRDFDLVNEPSRIKYRKLDHVLDRLGINSAEYPMYELTHETIGHTKADTSDVVLTGPSSTMKLSIKNNNAYIKHQRPNKLHLQLGLRSTDADKFVLAYKAINDFYYDAWKHLKTWNKVPTAQKFELYERINTLTIKWIGSSRARLSKYLSFVMDASDPHKYILKWEPGRNDFAIIRHQQHDFNLKQASLTIRDGSFIEIRLGDSLMVQLRIHNASSRITQTLSLKYTTQICP